MNFGEIFKKWDTSNLKHAKSLNFDPDKKWPENSTWSGSNMWVIAREFRPKTLVRNWPLILGQVRTDP